MVKYQAPPSLEFSRQAYWSGLPCLHLGIFLIQGLNLGLLHFGKILYHLSHQGSPNISELRFKTMPEKLAIAYVSHHPTSHTVLGGGTPEPLLGDFRQQQDGQ